MFQSYLLKSDYEASMTAQNELVNGTIKHDLNVRYPRSSAYIKLFLKFVINEVCYIFMKSSFITSY